jgi:hypothetical protein
MEGEMKGRSWFLVSGVVFLLGVWFAAAQFLARAQSPLLRADVMLSHVRVVRISVAILVHSVVGGLFGGFGSLLLFLYLKIRELEIEVKKLRMQSRSTMPAGSPVAGAVPVADAEQLRGGEVRTHRLAIVGLVLSCSGVVLGPFGCLAGIACGHLARREIRKDLSLRGGCIALAALIVGYTLLVLNIVLGIAAFVYVGRLL